MTDAIVHPAIHATTVEEVDTFNYRGDSETATYRWVCSCGKRGKGTHATQDAALAVSLNHVSPGFVKQTKTKPLSSAQRFTRGVTLLAERGFTSDEIWQTIWDLNAALRQGTGLGGGEMSDIIDAALLNRQRMESS